MFFNSAVKLNGFHKDILPEKRFHSACKICYVSVQEIQLKEKKRKRKEK